MIYSNITAILGIGIGIVTIIVHASGTSCNPPTISPSGVLLLNADEIVFISCTIETQSECDDPGVFSNLRKTASQGEAVIDSHADSPPINIQNRCTYNFTAKVTEGYGYATLHCGLPQTGDANCVSNESLHLLVSPVLAEELTDNSENQTYFCTLPCAFNSSEFLYTAFEKDYRDIGTIEDMEFINSKTITWSDPQCINDNDDRFKTTRISLNVSVSSFIDVLPNIVCGGRDRWVQNIYYSQQINRTTELPTIYDPTIVTTDPVTTETSSAYVNAVHIYNISFLFYLFCIIIITY